MNDDEKKEQLKIILNDASFDDKVLDTYLRISKQKILNRRFPFDEDRRQGKVPDEYELLQLELACMLINKRGAEGESLHNENGVNRSYRTESDILFEVTPLVGIIA